MKSGLPTSSSAAARSLMPFGTEPTPSSQAAGARCSGRRVRHDERALPAIATTSWRRARSRRRRTSRWRPCRSGRELPLLRVLRGAARGGRRRGSGRGRRPGSADPVMALSRRLADRMKDVHRWMMTEGASRTRRSTPGDHLGQAIPGRTHNATAIRQGSRRWRAGMIAPILVSLGMSAGLGVLLAGFSPRRVFRWLWLVARSGWASALGRPPEHIARWKRGSDGERSTERALQLLNSTEWSSYHDLDARYGNIDHVVVGPPASSFRPGA